MGGSDQPAPESSPSGKKIDTGQLPIESGGQYDPVGHGQSHRFFWLK